MAAFLAGAPAAQAAGKYALAYWYEVGAYQNQAPPAGEFGNRSAYLHVWNEDGTPRPGVRVYTSWGVLLGATDQYGFFELPLNLPNSYDFQVRDGAHLSDTTPIFATARAPNWGHYSWEIGFLFKTNANAPGTFDTAYDGLLNASGTEPCRDLSAPRSRSIAYHSTPTNYCGDSFSLGNFVLEHGQTFVATGNRVVAAKMQGTIGFSLHMNFTAQILAGGPGGPPVGPPRNSRTMVSDEYFPILVTWGLNEVQVVPGQTYYLKITRAPNGLNAYRVGNTYAGGQYYENGVAQAGRDLMGMVVCATVGPAGPSGTIRGSVREPDNRPVSGATVTATTAGRFAISAADGSYTLPDVPAGIHTVTVSKFGYITQVNVGVVVNDGQTNTLDLVLPPQPAANGSIVGTVTDPDLRPLGGARVTVYPANLSVTTAADGTYQFPSIVFGNYRVVAAKNGFATAVDSDVNVTNGQTTTLPFTLRPQLVRNGNFEGGFASSVGNSWTRFTWSGGSSATYVEEPQNRLSGTRSQRWWSSYATHHGGIHQRVPALLNSNYTFSAWTWRDDPWNNGSANQEMWVGLDPFGGTNANSGNVIWSPAVFSWRTWTRQSVTATARANWLTVFVRGRANWDGHPMVSVVDDAVLDGPAPYPLELLAQPGDGRVGLSWYATVPGATYNVKRGLVSGGPYAVLASGLTNPAFTDSAVTNGLTYHYVVSAVLNAVEGPNSPEASATPTAALTLVPAGAVWKYLDTGVDQGTAWRAPAFDDSRWAAGPARFGYGGDGEVTTVNYGPDENNKYPTTYFRHPFLVSGAARFTNLIVRLVRDDGGVVYLNGEEIFRSNMPIGEIRYGTFASGTVGGTDEFRFYSTNALPGLLREGVNVLAVEIHQVNATSSDLGFDLELVGEQEPLPPWLQIRHAGGQVELVWPSVPAGFRLESAAVLGPGAGWLAVPNPVVASNGLNRVTLSPGGGQAFYRLRRF